MCKGLLYSPLLYLYDSLARLAVYGNATKSEQIETLRKVKVNQNKMKKWGASCPNESLTKILFSRGRAISGSG
jgi:hypothetical protein